MPCELTYTYKPTGVSPYREELLSVEFRSPRATTYLLRAFPSGSNTLRIRFTPIETGTWTYRVSSSIHELDGQESTFSVADNGLPGFVSVANVRHWRTTNKQPHLWLSADVPFLELDAPGFANFLQARKRDGFTHLRGPLLTFATSVKPMLSNDEPNPAYFEALDGRILAAIDSGFVLDLILADDSFMKSGGFGEWQARDPLLRYLIARYSGLNITWQEIAHFEDRAGSRDLLKEIGSTLAKYDAYQHPRSSDARVSSSPLLPDGWMNYLMEASPNPEVGAVEHQFTHQPQIHVITATDADTFRHELWNCTTNGEYPAASYASLQNETNVRTLQIWSKIIANTRHWELEPYFDVSGARAVGLEEVEYLTYAQTPGIIEISLPKHKYNPFWINPATGEELPLKDYRGETFSRQTPDNNHDWILQVPREGRKESMLRSYRFESVDAPVQEVESDPAKIPFAVVDPKGDELNSQIPTPFQVKITRANRASRFMQYLWWGEVVAGGEGARLLGAGSSGNLVIPKELLKTPGANLNLRIQAINANGKAYEIDKVYRLVP
ncbi:MAG: DUF5060 domain-containing protein [Bryobacteraceae bacterium]